MTPEERDLIVGLFQRLTPPPEDQVDEEARALIDRLARERPLATYLLVQTALVQEHALKGAQARIAELEARCGEPAPAPARRSFLSGLFGGDTSPPEAAAPQPPAGRPMYQQGYQQMGGRMPMASGPWGSGMASSGPSFLRSALSTAAGVAGGALLFQGIERMLGYGGSPFAEAAHAEPAADQGAGLDDRSATGNVGADQDAGFTPDADQVQNADYTTEDPGTDFGADDFGGGGGFDDDTSI
jgi:hypothetical protein